MPIGPYAINMGEKRLEVMGPWDITKRPSVAIVGSRNASAKGRRVAQRLGLRIGQVGGNVVSGYANGIDTAAHVGALSAKASGKTTVVLPTGLSHWYVKDELKPLWHPDKICVVSEFEYHSPFSGKQAMTRNRTICEIADSVIIVEMGVGWSGTAGTFCDAYQMGVPLYIIDGNDLGVRCGNNGYARRGGQLITLDEIAKNGIDMFFEKG